MGKIYFRYIAPQYDFHQDSIRAGETLIVHGKERKQGRANIIRSDVHPVQV